MENFAANFKALPVEEKRAKLTQIIGFMYQQNALKQADAFCELKACYPIFPLSKEEFAFREYLAWMDIQGHASHPAVRHVIAQG